MLFICLSVLNGNTIYLTFFRLVYKFLLNKNFVKLNEDGRIDLGNNRFLYINKAEVLVHS